jgi:hypothetical protein
MDEYTMDHRAVQELRLREWEDRLREWEDRLRE